MKNLLYGAFTTLVMFGLGKAIYDKGKRDGVNELQKTINLVDIGRSLEHAKIKVEK
jgi:hypothetical protein